MTTKYMYNEMVQKLIRSRRNFGWGCRQVDMPNAMQSGAAYSFFFACGKKTYSQCEKTKNLELVLFSLFTSDTRYMCVKNSS